MKKTIIKVLALSLVAVMMCAILVSCSTLSGKYSNETLGIKSTYEFKGDEFTATAMGVTISGTYKIEGDEITFTYSLAGEEISTTEDFEKVSGGIKIDGVEYTKE